MALRDGDLFGRLERFYDAVPRDIARAEEIGGLVLFVRDGAGWPLYARPRRNADHAPSAADITATRARQRELGVPEAFEWVHETSPDLLAVARSAGLSVLQAPLMLLRPEALAAPEDLSDVPVRLVDPASERFGTDVARAAAVAAVGFADPGLEIGDAGAAERDAAVREPAGDELSRERQLAVAGRRITALADSPTEGALASGVVQRVDDVAEIVGVATLPTARRRGLAAAVTAALARRALDTGATLVFLTAGSEDIARVYLRVGFHRVGTACIAEPSAATV
ncbi:FR47-like protein [Micromonospora pattaloongensis]|uniref:FR47-like protein n=1 Tax=Micromonospora pattaloongensis TaxID=405436 RepID=A0A1H3Q6K9_9ACTN|nr:GNAT family N-acetyltransferase [Micromonospora pattaloongensis]SDZ09016.1 FR47-like protein [Micromonospora pattaloongensis]